MQPFRRDFEQAFERCDVLAMPTAPSTAFEIGAKSGAPLKMYLSDILTISINLAGLPGMSIPCGFDRSGLPIGLQLAARPLDEPTLLRAAAAYEDASDWHRKRPSVEAA